MCIRDRVSVEYDGVFEPYITPPGQSPHFAAQGFDLLGGATFEALPPDSLIAKQFRFVGHHVLLHAEIGVNFDIEVHHSPLAEGTLYHAAVLRELMAPEQALLLLSLGGKLLLKALSGVLRLAPKLPNIHTELSISSASSVS